MSLIHRPTVPGAPSAADLQKQQAAQKELRTYLKVYWKAYSDPKHPEHEIISEEVQALSRAAAGPNPDEPIGAGNPWSPL